MYERLRDDILMQLADLPAEVLLRVSVAFDTAAQNYTITEAETALAVLGRDEFKQIAGAYFISKRTEGLSPNTIEHIARVLGNFINKMVKPVSEIKANDIRAYLYNYQKERGVSNRSLDFVRTIICTFFKWAAAEEYIPSNPSVNVKPIKYVRKPRKALSQIELERIRRTCRDERETCIVEVLYSTGCRVSELCNIRIDDINWEKHEITVLGKGSKYRKVFLNAKSLISIDAYLKSRKHASEWLVCNERGGGQMHPANVQKIFARMEKETGIFVTPHIMRHTMATQALTGTSIEVVQQMLGHSNIATTMVYAEVDPSSIHAAHIRSVI